MFTVLLYVIIIVDAVVLAARNAAVWNAHLDPAAHRSLTTFNAAAIFILALAAGLLILRYLLSSSSCPSPKTSRWPLAPPD